MLATGGIGKAYKITSNSWEYTGDGHALALWAGADLIDMEFVQFHPTGMVWPPSVRGILVTEGVRGDGGVLKNSDGERFMFRYIPEMFRGRDRRHRGGGRPLVHRQEDARGARPTCCPATRSRGRSTPRSRRVGGVPHGGVFLDIATRRDAEYIKRRLPSMYHQFLQLADVDITKEPMEVGPTCHYMMGGVRVDAETQASTVPGLFAAGEVRGWDARREPARRQLAVRPRSSSAAAPGSHAAEYAGRPRPPGRRSTTTQVDELARDGAARRSTRRAARTRTRSSRTSRSACTTLVGIIRTEDELDKALEELAVLQRPGGASAGRRPPAVQPRLAPRARPPVRCSPSPSASPAPRSSGARAAARTPVTTTPTPTPSSARSTSSSAERDGELRARRWRTARRCPTTSRSCWRTQ